MLSSSRSALVQRPVQCTLLLRTGNSSNNINSSHSNLTNKRRCTSSNSLSISSTCMRKHRRTSSRHLNRTCLKLPCMRSTRHQAAVATTCTLVPQPTPQRWDTVQAVPEVASVRMGLRTPTRAPITGAACLATIAKAQACTGPILAGKGVATGVTVAWEDLVMVSVARAVTQAAVAHLVCRVDRMGALEAQDVDTLGMVDLTMVAWALRRWEASAVPRQARLGGWVAFVELTNEKRRSQGPLLPPPSPLLLYDSPSFLFRYLHLIHVQNCSFSQPRLRCGMFCSVRACLPHQASTSC